MTLAVLLTLIAFALVMLELAFPSFGLLSLMAATAYTFSLILAFREGDTLGWTLVGSGLLLLPLAFYFGLKLLPRTPLGRALFLRGPQREEIQRGTRSSELAERLLGATGQAVTDLRPSGTAEAAGMRIDVVTDGSFIPRGAPIVVVSVDGQRIMVNPAPSPQPDPPREDS
jgi:membrane-bound serine protease (ClpP class)